MPDQIHLKELPRRDAPDYFRALVRNCIETYKELPNDAMCLDYNKVSGKFRMLVLDDEEYKQETRNIYANQRLKELREIDTLAKLALNDEADDDDEDEDPRSRGKGKKKKISGADKDMLTMRFKAAQLRRELIASLNEDNNAFERDAASFMYVPISEEELRSVQTDELYEGDADGALDELADRKEKAPEGTGGKIQNRGKIKPPDDEDFFEIRPDGGVVEK
jgi:hypothetical protein